MATDSPDRNQVPFRILIIGGGIAGFAAAVGLRRKGHNVTVIERSAQLQTFGGSLLISANALRVIDDYGLLENFQSVAVTWDTHTIYTHDGKVLDVLSNKANEKVFGYEMLNVYRPLYQRVLYEGAIREGVEVRFDSRVEVVDEKSPSITLSTGEKIEADLIIGADGIKSIIRPAVLGGEDIQLRPNSTCYQCSIPAALMEADPLTVALQLEKGIQSWWGPNRHFICGRKKGGKAYEASFFIHPAHYPSLTKQSPTSVAFDASASNSQNSDRRGDINDILSNVSVFEPRVRAFVQMIKPEDCRLWKVAEVPDLRTWVSESGRLTLLGDAAHAMSPHIGQGAAMSIEDGGILAECIGRASSVADIPKAVQAYETIQKSRAEKIKKTALVSGVFKTLEDGPQRRKRDIGFEERLQKGPKYEFWRASGHLEWIYGFDYKKVANMELDKVFGIQARPIARARI